MDIKEELQYSLLWNLVMESPVLSGNMQSFIHLGYGNDGYEIMIEAPFYDAKRWQKDKVIVHTGANKNGVTDYALSVNEVGAFGSHNKSEHWANRVINQCCEEIAKKYHGKVEKRLVE